ncbi:MAG: hypothetical protein ACRDRZ_16805 [Pseudonocardiaceae bacterium]
MSMPNFAQSNQGLAAMQQHQQGLQAAVDAGRLWMEPLSPSAQRNAANSRSTRCSRSSAISSRSAGNGSSVTT